MTCLGCHSHVTQRDSLLGRLGRLLWFRCRYCGIEFNREIPAKKLRAIEVE